MTISVLRTADAWWVATPAGAARGTTSARTTAELLAAARPRLAIVSAGVRNPYGHPAPAVLNRLERSGARVLRTDRDGAVELRWGARGPLRIYLPASPRRSGAAGG